MREINLNGERYVHLDDHLADLTTVTLDGEMYVKATGAGVAILDGDGDLWVPDSSGQDVWYSVSVNTSISRSRQEIANWFKIKKEF